MPARKVRGKQVQNHHISYDPEIIVPIWKGEHRILALLARQKEFSQHFLEELEVHVVRHRYKAVDLEEKK